MPAVLVEVSCLSNAEEVELLAHPLYRDHIAEALYKGIAGYARDVNSPDGAGLGP
jgi:N-acetylmuramoyl-L-alanine amidase